MITYATSDLHGNLPDVPPDADLILIAGDVCPDFGYQGGVNKDGLSQRDWLCGVFKHWLDTFEVPAVMIWGNHDFIGEKSWLVGDVRRALGPRVAILQDSAIILGGKLIYGTPWVPGLPYWAFYARTEALDARAALIPERPDVLMTHGPPLGAGDYIPGGSEKQVSKYGNTHGMNVGDSTLNRAIARTKPKVVICGHIHEDRGDHLMNEFTGRIVNCAAVDAMYDLRPEPWVRLYELEG